MRTQIRAVFNIADDAVISEPLRGADLSKADGFGVYITRKDGTQDWLEDFSSLSSARACALSIKEGRRFFVEVLEDGLGWALVPDGFAHESDAQDWVNSDSLRNAQTRIIRAE